MTTMTDPVVAPERPELDDTGRDGLAHWALASAVTEGYVTGTRVLALCGRWFVPSRDPEGVPRCVECDRIKAQRYA